MDSMIDAMGRLRSAREGHDDEYANAPKEDLAVPDWLTGWTR